LSVSTLPKKLVSWVEGHGIDFFALSLYVILTVIFTWPLAANFASFVNGNVMDVFHEMWYLNLDYHSAFGPFFQLYTNHILYPYGVPLYFQVVSPLHAIIGAPVYFLFGLVPTYNFLYMFTFFASAFTMYVFVNYLTNNRYAAFFAGLAFGFAPVHTGQGLSHLNIMASEMLPVFGYFFVRMTREPRDREAIYAGVAIALNAMLDLHFLLLSGIIIVSFLLYSLLAQRRVILNKRYAVRFGIMVLVAGVIGLVVYYQAFYGLIFAPSALGATAAATASTHVSRSPDLLQFILPSPQNPILGRFTAGTYSGFLSFSDVQTFIGFTVLALSIVGIFAQRKKREVIFWAFLSIVGFLVSLGPYVIVDGQITRLQGIWTYLEYLIPYFKSFRTPFRIDYLVAFGMAILSGYGVTALMGRIDRLHFPGSTWRTGRGGTGWFWTFTKLFILALLCTSVAIEFLPAPYPEMNAAIPSFYTQVLANDHSNFTVLEVPAYSSNDVYLYYQTAYSSPVINGHISRTPPESLIFTTSYPFIDQLGTYIRGRKALSPDIINQTISVTQIAPYILAQYNIKYVIVHSDLLAPALYSKVVALISSVLGLPYYVDSTLTVFRYIPPTPSFGLANYPRAANVTDVAFLSGGWNPYGLPGHRARTLTNAGGLNVYMQSTQFAQLSFVARGLNNTDYIQVQVNGQSIGTYQLLPGKYQLYSTPFMMLSAGYNQVTFTSLQGCQPVSYGGNSLTPPATICVSGEFSSIAITGPTATSH